MNRFGQFALEYATLKHNINGYPCFLLYLNNIWELPFTWNMKIVVNHTPLHDNNSRSITVSDPLPPDLSSSLTISTSLFHMLRNQTEGHMIKPYPGFLKPGCDTEVENITRILQKKRDHNLNTGANVSSWLDIQLINHCIY